MVAAAEDMPFFFGTPGYNNMMDRPKHYHGNYYDNINYDDMYNRNYNNMYFRNMYNDMNYNMNYNNMPYDNMNYDNLPYNNMNYDNMVKMYNMNKMNNMEGFNMQRMAGFNPGFGGMPRRNRYQPNMMYNF